MNYKWCLCECQLHAVCAMARRLRLFPIFYFYPWDHRRIFPSVLLICGFLNVNSGWQNALCTDKGRSEKRQASRNIQTKHQSVCFNITADNFHFKIRPMLLNRTECGIVARLPHPNNTRWKLNNNNNTFLLQIKCELLPRPQAAHMSSWGSEVGGRRPRMQDGVLMRWSSKRPEGERLRI